jgi:hypothetical protein
MQSSQNVKIVYKMFFWFQYLFECLRIDFHTVLYCVYKGSLNYLASIT